MGNETYICKKIEQELSEKKIFISSTIKNMKKERELLRELFREPLNSCGMKFKAIFSEIPQYLIHAGNNLRDFIKNDPNLAIVEKVSTSDFYLLLINEEYYGVKNIRDEEYNDIISVTHAEFREANRKKLPIFVFVTEHFFRKYKILKWLSFDYHICWKANETWKACCFFNEIRKQKKKINISTCTYKSIDDLENSVSKAIGTYERSSYVFSTSDKGIYLPEEEFEIEWVIENSGCTVWKNRYFVEKKPKMKRFWKELCKFYFGKNETLNLSLKEKIISALKRIREFYQAYFAASTAETQQFFIPEIFPGEQVCLSVKYKAPKRARKIISTWKIVDENKKMLFPSLMPLTLEYKCISRYE